MTLETPVGESVIVLLHGRGGAPADVAWLRDVVPAPWQTVCVEGWIPLGDGFEWFALPDTSFAGLLSDHVAGAVDALVAWVDVNVRATRVGLVGFSQGGALAVQALRRHPRRFTVAAAFAGFMSVDAERGDTELAARRPPFLWVRGSHDDVIRDTEVARMRAFLPAHTSLEERVHPDAGHEITAAMAADLARFLG